MAYYLTGVVTMLAYMATLWYAVGAIGFFDDPAHTRIVDAVVCVVLLVLASAGQRLMVRLGRRWRAHN